jgi:hypothetical protein
LLYESPLLLKLLEHLLFFLLEKRHDLISVLLDHLFVQPPGFLDQLSPFTLVRKGQDAFLLNYSFRCKVLLNHIVLLLQSQLLFPQPLNFFSGSFILLNLDF